MQRLGHTHAEIERRGSLSHDTNGAKRRSSATTSAVGSIGGEPSMPSEAHLPEQECSRGWEAGFVFTSLPAARGSRKTKSHQDKASHAATMFGIENCER